MALLPTLKALATSLLTQFGRSITVRRVTGTTADPVAGTVAKTTLDVAAVAYFDQVTQYNAPAGASVEVNDVLAYIDQEVAVEDQVIREGVVWEVVHVDPTELEGGIALWTALLRR